MVYWLENVLIDGVLIWKRGSMGNIPSIQLVSGAASQLLFTSELGQEKWRSLLSEDEMAVFLTKTERKESKNT